MKIPRRVAMALTAVMAALASSYSHADAAIFCVHGTVQPPRTCEPLKTFTDIYDAQAASKPGDEVRVYGTVKIPDTLTLVARKLTGFSGAVLDATNSRDPVAIRIVQAAVLTNLTLWTSHTTKTQTGIQLDNPGRIVTLNGVSIFGPADGKGIGIEVRPGAGRLTVYGNTQRSEISGHGIGIFADDPQGRPSVNGGTADEVKGLRVKIRNVDVGIQDAVSVPAQWFKTEVNCERTGGVGYLGIASKRSDLNGLVIHDCAAGLRLECIGSDCGGPREFDNLRVDTAIAVQAMQPGGAVVNDYQADRGCGDQWGQSTRLNGVFIPKKFVVACP